MSTEFRNDDRQSARSRIEYSTRTLRLNDRLDYPTSPPGDRSIEGQMHEESIQVLESMGSEGWNLVSLTPTAVYWHNERTDIGVYRATFLRVAEGRGRRRHGRAS